MNQRISDLREYIAEKKHHSVRRTAQELGIDNLCDNYSKKDMSPMQRASSNLSTLLGAETPVILPGERIVFTRTISSVPDLFTEAEWAEIKSRVYLHEKGYVCNISPDYEYTLRIGLDARKKEIRDRLNSVDTDNEGKEFLLSAYECVEALQNLIERYAQYAFEAGEKDTAEVLNTIKINGATSLREALQLLRVLHFSLWMSGNYHNTLGRFDQYIYPYFANDIKTGSLTPEEAFDLIEEFFLVCNKDSDLYPGMQQGDNGQSLVLGGRDAKGRYLFNDLSKMCLKASYELNMIDPKINIRVDKDTPDEIFEMGSELTKIGLGFPQYSNDDVVIAGLIDKGYSEEDARNYVVAACWEFIIPGVGMDVPNIDAVSLIECVNQCVPKLNECNTYQEFCKKIETAINARVNEICANHQHLYMIPAPMMSVLMDGTIERARDISKGSKYNNYGIHGTGIATAVDSMAAIKKFYFDEKLIDYPTLISALDNNFEGYDEVKSLLRNEAPKMGQANEEVDIISKDLLNSFSRTLKGRVNERGGLYRAGTGTAMYYIFHSRELGATADGRTAGEVIPANYSPSLFIKQQGPLSVIKSFTAPDMKNVINGGPLTLEFDQSIFKSEESVKKLAKLVKIYITLGGHQLQLNTVSRDKLLDAKIHPQQYKNLIVRVWGWSGYFVELDECYQDHVINRIEFGL